MENMLMIAAIAANDFNAWVCAHCETNNFGDTKVCICCSMLKWSTCDIECEHTLAPASIAVFVDLSGDVEYEDAEDEIVMQVPLPYMHWYEVPANYGDLMDAEREGALQLKMRLV